MAQYIDKNAVVAEIERKKIYAQTLGDNAINSSMQQFYDGMKQGCVDILSSIDAIEVKEVDLDVAIDKWIDDAAITHEDCGITDIISTAKHFFELGLKANKGE